jgi:hypothetical protein
MVTDNKPETVTTVLLAAARNIPIASRMAIRFSQAGCRVAAVYPSKAHLLAGTASVASHYHYGVVAPVESLLDALRESGAALVIPCDSVAVRHLHALYAQLPATPEGMVSAQVIQRSLGDPAAYLLIDSRHEVQTAARAEGLPAAESFAIGRTTDLGALAQSVSFPWVVKADYSWGGRGTGVVHSLAEAGSFIRLVGAPPSLAMAAKQSLINSDRAALGDWLHAKRTGLSAQRPVSGPRATAAVACWRGTVLAMIAVEVVSPPQHPEAPAVVRIMENEQMEKTVKRVTDRLGLCGFHNFDFILDTESGVASLTEFNSYCAEPAHLNAGPGRDLVDAFCRKWLERPAAAQPAVHSEPLVAYYPRAWATDPSDPILSTGAYDTPVEDPQLAKRMMQLVRRDRRYLRFKSGLMSVFGIKRGQ